MTVRTLHHYDEIGLLRPASARAAGYRLYTDEDLERLQHVVVYRRLGFPLEEIARCSTTGDADVEAHLRRQRAAVMSRLDELRELVAAIDRALEREMNGNAADARGAEGALRRRVHRGVRRARPRSAGATPTRGSSRGDRTTRYTKADWRRDQGGGRRGHARVRRAQARGRSPATRRRRWTPPRRTGGTSTDWFYDLGYTDPPRPRRHVRRRPAVHEDLRRPRARAGAVRPRRDPRQRRPARTE